MTSSVSSIHFLFHQISFFVLFSFHVLEINFLIETGMKMKWNRNNNFRRKIAYCVLSSIIPDGFTQCPTASTDISTGIDATNNGTAITQYSNDIENGNHQESCLWPNALQVILTLFHNCFIFSLIFCFPAILILFYFIRYVFSAFVLTRSLWMC